MIKERQKRCVNTVSCRKSIFASMLLAFGALTSGGASATLLNADFSAGFTSWSGEIATFDFTGPGDSGIGAAIPSLETNYPDNYILPGGGAAKISTSATADVDTYFVSLFQDFTVDSIAGGSTLELSLAVTAVLTDTFNGAVQLIDNNSLLTTLDLTAGGTFDITAWAGADAQFALTVKDDDFTLPTTDMLTVSGITFTEKLATIPEPGSLLMLGMGLIGLWGSRRQGRKA